MSNFEQVRDLPNLYIDNLQLARASNTALTVTSGQCRDETNVFDIVVTDTSTTINAALNGKNGLDTGALAADTIYYVYAIADATVHNEPAFILSANATGPLMPEGYNIKRKIGIWGSDNSSHLREGYTTGIGKQRTFYLAQPTTVTTGTSTSYANVNLGLIVPPIDNTEVYFSVGYVPNLANNQLNFKSGGGAYDQITVNGQVATVPIYHAFRLLSKLVSSEATVAYKVESASDSLQLFVESFIYYV